ncbi:hypothetical protein BUALT_Bualt02G0006900 [Buddleja alternifolia]|uniref:Uncharacterized protein n=1 Tax=Buddleja alternifolia TaxID=168488 RepID=A0AAV6XX06_9LAMI|nr:hypothetical protein BUALT_Bualt02G0006900 [Buddleja alternifolia]
MAPKKTKTVKLFEVKVEVDNSAHNTYPSMSLITPEIGSSAARSRSSGHVRRIENYVQNYEEFSIARDVNTSMRLSGPGSAITHENKGDFMEKRAKKMKFTDQESAKDDTDMSLGIIAWKPSVSRFADESPYFLKISDNEDFKISDQGPTKEDMVESHLEKIIVVSEKHLYRKTQSRSLYPAAQLTKLQAALQTSDEYLRQAASSSQHFQVTSHSDNGNHGHVPSTDLLQNNNASDVSHKWASEQSLDANAINSATPNSSESMSQVSQGLGQRQHDVNEWQQNQHSQIQPPEQHLALSIPRGPLMIKSL